MDKFAIEKEARRLQVEIWSRRERRFALGVPRIPEIFDPRNVADYCGLEYEFRSSIGAERGSGFEAAGVISRERMTISLSTQFSYEVQRYTGAHEIGHYILHPHIGDRAVHRDRPTDGGNFNKPQIEREADYFAACLLMPRRAVENEFEARFGTKKPLALTETVAFHLGADGNVLFSSRRGSLTFARAVARATKFDTNRFVSIAEFFFFFFSAMAIRLEELKLVSDYLEC